MRRVFSICLIWSLIVRHLSLQLRQGVGRDRTPFRCAQSDKLLWCFEQFWVEPSDAQPHQCCFHPVDDTRALVDELLALAMRPFRVFLFE
jgi:hypothetical protein